MDEIYYITLNQFNNPLRRRGGITYVRYEPSDFDIELATRFVINARDSHRIHFKRTPLGLKLYDLYYNKWTIRLMRLVIFLDVVLLSFFERPAFIVTPQWVHITIELFCLSFFIIRWIHARLFRLDEPKYIDKTHLVILIVIILNSLDLMIYIIVFYSKAGFVRRYTRSLRIVYYVNFTDGTQLKRAFKNLKNTVPEILRVYKVFFVSLLIFAFLLWNLLKNKNLTYSNGDPYFVNYGDSIYDLYIAITTANFPDVMMPAYNYNGFFAILFIAFMVLNLFLFINIMLATSYSHFRECLREEIRNEVQGKRYSLEEAFHLLKKKVPGEIVSTEYAIDFETFTKMMKLLDPTKSDNKIKTLFSLLDLSGDNYLVLNEFLYLIELLNVRITEVKDRQNIFERWIPKIYSSKPSEVLKKIIRHRATDVFLDLATLANFITVFIGANRFEFQISFWTLFLVEILMKIYVYGRREYFMRSWNIFDLFVVLTGFILLIIELSMDKMDKDAFRDPLIVVRVFRIVKVLTNIKTFREIILTLINVSLSLVTYGSLILCVFYFFVMIGMELYGDLIQSFSLSPDKVDCSNPLLINTDFANLKYCKNNFDNIVTSFVLMFELLVVNNWFVLASGFIKVTSKWSRLFFIAFHMIGVVVSLNIFTALFLELFWIDTNNISTFESTMEKRINELSLNFQKQTSEVQSTETIIENPTLFKRILNIILEYYDCDRAKDMSKVNGLKFHMTSRGPRNVESLLFKLFSDEFDIRTVS